MLNYLEGGEQAKMSALRSATGANKSLLEGMVRKKWLVREAVAEERDARRLEKVAVLVAEARLPKLNDNQTAILAEIAAVGGRMRVRDLQLGLARLGVPVSTLGTLVKRGLVTIEEVAEEFHVGGVSAQGKKHAHEHDLNEAQMEALGTIAAAMEKGGFQAASVVWDYRVGEDYGLFCGDAAGVGCGEVGAAAGAGDWVDAGDGGADGGGVCGRGGVAAFAVDSG